MIIGDKGMEIVEKYEVLEVKDKIKKTFHYKPKGVIATVFVVGLLMVASALYVTGIWVIGVMMILISIFVLIGLKDHKVLGICNDYMIVYNPKDETKGKIVAWDEIVEWKALASGSNEKATGLLLLLEGDEVVYVEMFGAFQISRVLRKEVPAKESSKVQISRIKNTPLSWFNKKG